MIEIPDMFAPSPEEAAQMEIRTQELEAAKVAFLEAQAQNETRKGNISAVVGKISMRKATKEARSQGLTIDDGHVIVPYVVPLAYYHTLEDDFFSF